ncbi:Increased rDNA silencing protein [Ascosphaera pollenicola]|nr:Increased rDNA silencing protein [Ascosphaera pollenicola]
MTPNKEEDHATALQGATQAFKAPTQLSPDLTSSTNGAGADENFARIAALREFDARRRQIGHRGYDTSDTESHDDDIHIDFSRLQTSRSPSSSSRKAGIVDDRVRQFSRKAADRAVDRQQRRSVSLQRPKNGFDAQHIAAKLAAEREKASRPASADGAAKPHMTKSGVIIVPNEPKDQSSHHLQREPDAQGASPESAIDAIPPDDGQRHEHGHDEAYGNIHLVRTSHVPPMSSSNSLLTMFDRQGSVHSHEERPKPPVKPRKVSTHPKQQQQQPPKLPARQNPAERSSSSLGTRSTDISIRRPSSLKSGISEESSSSTRHRDSLDGAVAASNLAASRARENPPIPPPRRRVGAESRSPSPPKPVLKQTLRKEKHYDIDELERQKRIRKHHHNLFKKHPHKHHEGARKRWRDTVTERERKRYEGVWAANKGLWIVFDSKDQPINPSKKILDALPEGVSPGDIVLNVVVQDIWNRSHLPQDTLAAIWDLVSHTAYGMLSREEFVVGMWLIDQCLKGRKLPIKVSQSVWASTQSLSGLKIKLTRC